MQFRYSKLAAALTTAVLAMGISGIADAAANPGIVGKMDEIFGDMSNVTKPGVYKSARRGIITGGGISTRSRIVDTSLININFQKPTGGCGGIDAFAGSISFINADQFVELLRSIASNAKGYAFQVAMNAASSLIASILGDMQKVVQSLNDLNINSCQLAQGLVNSAISSVQDQKLQADVSLTNALSGFNDVAQAFRNFGNSKNNTTETFKAAQTNADLKATMDSTYGNVLWKELKRNNIKKLMTSSNEDTEYGTIMAITGTYVTEAPKENDASPQTSNFPITPYDHLLEPKDYIEGGTFKIYTCGTDQTDCAAPTKKTITLKGLKNQIMTALVGDASSVGMIAKFHSGEGAKLSDSELKVYSGLPLKAATVISNLSMYSPDAARDLAEEIAYAVAMHNAYEVTRQYLRMARYAISSSKMAGKEQTIEMINSRLATLDSEFLAYSKVHRPLVEIMNEYNQIQKNITKMALLTSNQRPNVGSDGAIN